jgi:HlyD family secretion protein
MTMQENKAISRLLYRKIMVIGGIVIVIIMLASVIILKLFAGKDKISKDDMPIFVVKQGPLRINIIESGTIKARQQVIIKNQVEGRTTILSLVSEGTLAKKGDLLIELDSSKLLDNKIDQEIKVQNADAAFVRARENLAVVKNQAESDKDKALLNLKFARLDLEKYIDPNEGEYSNQLTEAMIRITLAEEELERAKNKLEWSERLYNEKYISKTELQEDQLTANKAKLDLDLKRSDLNLLRNFTYTRELAQLESDVKQAYMALERTERKARADVIQAEADLRAKESEFNRQKDKLKKVEEQIEKTKIYAPADGLVIYATSAKGSWRGNAEPLDEGQEIRERQELIYLPTALSMKAEVKVHEASMKKIDLGLRTIIKVDALQDKVFTGSVGKIAPLPDAQMIWLNPDLKVYNTEVYIDNEDEDMRTGMSCKAEIIIEEYENATYIPLQSIVQIKGKPTVYVITGGDIKPREIEIGLDNNRMVRIIKGLAPGERVLLAPPLAEGTVEIDTIVKQKEPLTEKKARKRPDAANMTDEQKQKMREKFEKMSPEEREKLISEQMNKRRRNTEGK